MKSYTPQPLIDKLRRDNQPFYGEEFFRNNPGREWVGDFRTSLASALGIPPLSRGRSSLTLKEKRDKGKYAVESYLFEGEGNYPLHILVPSGREDRGKTILAFHGHGPGVRAMIEKGMEGECHNHFGVTLAEAGFTVVMPELIGFGQCRLNEDIREGRGDSCQTLALELLPLGYTLTGLRLWQALTVLDLIEERHGTSRLGCFGFSGGGQIGYLLAALDERIRALGLSGYCSTFGDSIYERCHCPDNYIPGIYRLCDQPEIARLIAPRPLFVEAGREDGVFSVHGARKGIERIHNGYEEAGAGKNFCAALREGGHEIYGQDMITWMGEVLS